MLIRWPRIILISILLIFNFAKTSSKKRVCVIGAGMAGIAAIRQLSEHLDEIEPIVFEKNSDVGGLWIYSDSQDLDENGLPVHSRVYKNMRINVLKEALAYPDLRPFEGRECHSHVSHNMVLEYMRNYTTVFKLRQFIKFNTLVEKVEPICKNSRCQFTKWTMHTKNLITDIVSTTICDYVMVCNGHFYTPRIPEIQRIELFTGQVIHSSIYRTPEQFTGQTVVVLGASISGIDISLDLSPHVKTVYLSHRHEKIKDDKIPANVLQVRGVIAADNDKLILQDNSTITADAMIYSTGYLYTLPFLDNSSGITIDDNFVYPLFKQLVNVENPSMAFIGIPLRIINPAFFYFQSKYFTAVIRGKAHLPSKKQMLKDAQLPPGRPKSKAHLLGDDEWPLYTYYSKQGGFGHLPKLYKMAKITDEKLMREHPVSVKDYDLIEVKQGQFAYILSNDTCPMKIIL